MSNSSRRQRIKPNDYKIMFIGESGVGKSSILARMADDTFNAGFLPTIGIDFRRKALSVDGVEMALQLWDTAGQERFRSITTAYYRGAEAFALVFDVTNMTSFERIAYWVNTLRTHTNAQIPAVLIANKIDCVRQRVVEQKDGLDLARKYGMPYFETSAKTGEGVSEAVEHLARSVRKSRRESRQRLSDEESSTDSEQSTEDKSPRRTSSSNKRRGDSPKDAEKPSCCVVA